MRTAIFLGLTAIADAIRKDWLTDETIKSILAVLFVMMLVMDIAEFIKNMCSNPSPKK